MGATTCATCGASIPDRYRRCGSCGTSREAERGPVEIRRFATVVNSDLKGSTALGERLDPETLREVLTLYFDEMRAVLESHGGTIEKIIGDAIVAVFGLPVRHDDDALRAVEAAAETQRALAALNDRLEQKWAVRLVVRTGIATGEVVFGEASIGQHVLTGDTMAISSAMEQAAPPLEVLIAGSTYDLVHDMVDAEPVDAVVAKGSHHAHRAYRLVSVATRPQAGHAATDTAAAGLRLCPACGEENPASFRHCGMCGATLALVAPARESRKTVTIVFADPKPAVLDGATPSPETLRDVMTRYFEAMRIPLEAHGGTVERFIGDAVMAVFGLPVRHEDDALRAVRAAAAMQAALPVLNDQLRATWGMEIGNHVGVNTGEVIAGDSSLGQRLVTGDAVNTAARLEQAAGARRDRHRCVDLSPRARPDRGRGHPAADTEGQGRAGPGLPARRVAPRPGERAAAATPFVGRKQRWRRLETALLEVIGNSLVPLVTVVGDAGVGKSRLIREFADGRRASTRRCCAAAAFRTVTASRSGRSRRSSETRPGIATRITRGRAREDPGDRSEGTADGMDDAAKSSIGSRLRSACPRRSIPDPSCSGDPQLLEAIAKPTAARCDRRRCPRRRADIPRAPRPPTDAVQDSPILLLTTARHELFETRSRMGRGARGEQVILQPFSTTTPRRSSASFWAASRRPSDDESSTPRRATHSTSSRSPRCWSRAVPCAAMANVWVATGSSERLDIPPTIEALVGARLDALQHDERPVIDPASVIGLGFAVDALVNLIPEDAAAAPRSVSGRSPTKQFIRPTDGRRGVLPIRTRADQGCRVSEPAQAHSRRAPRALRRLGRADQPRARPRHRVRGDPRLPPRAVLPLPLRARSARRRRHAGSASARRTSSAAAGRRAMGRGDTPSAAGLLERRATAVRLVDDAARLALVPGPRDGPRGAGGVRRGARILDDAIRRAGDAGDGRLAAKARLVDPQPGELLRSVGRQRVVDHRGGA